MLAKLLGFETVEVGEGRATVRATVSGDHLNMHGGAHGGFLFSLADEAFALASNSYGVSAVALDVNMTFFQVVREGDVLEAVCSEENLGRRVATYRVEIKRGEEAVALFAGTVYRLEKRQPT